MSEGGSERDEPIEGPVLKHPILTPDFETTYVILDIICETESFSKVIIEDLEYADRYYLVRYVLEQNSKSEKIKNYYTSLEQFTKSILSPPDMIRLWKTASHFTTESTEEFLVFFELGEPDCIDLTRLTKVQTLKFLKNMIEVLETTYRVTSITNGDVCLDNILLVGNQLKLGGWRPYFVGTGETEDSWRDHVVRISGKKRLDILGVGLLWMQLCQVELKEIIATRELPFEQFTSKVLDLLHTRHDTFPEDHILVTKMYPALTQIQPKLRRARIQRREKRTRRHDHRRRTQNRTRRSRRPKVRR